MNYINIRNEKKKIKKGTSLNLHIPEYNIIIKDTIFGNGVTVWSNVNIYGAEIGENTKIGAFVEIQKNVKIGKNVKIEAMVFIPGGVIIEDCVFIGPNVVFTNDKSPRACSKTGKLKKEIDWKLTSTVVEEGASIGALSVILCGVVIGKHALIGVGSTVIESVPENAVVFGEKARIKRYFGELK